MNSRYVLDSWALLAFIYEENPAASRIETLLAQAADGNAYLTLSLINLGEIFYIFGRRRGKTAAEQLLAYVKNLPVHILPVDEARVLAAARFKMAHSLAYADAFAAAAAAELAATLVTGDPELLALSSELKIEKLSREG